jgi:hypothetical protein
LSFSLSAQSIFHFEDFSNELFYEIFDFLDVYHVYQAFCDLNLRFQRLINSTLPLKINISSCISKSTFQHYYTYIIIPNKHRIQSLYLSNTFIVDLFFSPVRIASKLIRLDTLIFDNIKSKYLPNILNYLVSLSNLPSLVIIPLDLIHKSNDLCRQIFRLPALTYCKLSLEGDAESEPLTMATDEISPIKQLVVTKTVHLNELPALLSYVPQLRRLLIHSLDESCNQ